MNWLDLLVISIPLLAAVRGFAAGAVQTVLGLVGAVVSGLAVAMFYPLVFSWLPAPSISSPMTQIVLVAVLLFVVHQMVGRIISLLLKIIGVVFALPLTKTIDRVLGIIAGGAEGFLFVVIALLAIFRFTTPPAALADALTHAWIARGLLFLCDWFLA